MNNTQASLKQIGEALVSLSGELDTKTVGTSHDATVLHGNGGIFSNAVERDVISAHMTPRGIASLLPMLPGVMEDPRFASLTGFTADVGTAATKACDDAQTTYIKGCLLTARFGMIRRDTNTIDMDQVMRKKNRGDFTDLVLYGRMLGQNIAPNVTSSNILNVITQAEMVGAAVSTERELSKQIWQGTMATANNFPGLDLQIATGQLDADSSALCPALDSDVKDFGYSLIDGTAKDIVEYVSMLAYYLENNARGMGLDPVTWVFAMTPQLWQELTAVWPCRYLTNRCTNSSGSNVAVINDTSNTDMRNDMRNNMILPVNGKNYRVVVDDGIRELTPADNANILPGQYASSIYMVPLTIVGSMPVTYREYLDYRQAAPDIALLNGMNHFWTDDGVYSWYVEQIKYCYKLGLKTEQRIVLRTPQLAGKIQRVKYTPLQHLRSPYPESSYFADGGVSARGRSWGDAVWTAARQ